ncbi:hypothetical protein HZ326_3205 [Fusarium oxysporum f. sp. albedinis]|nr:hypothetical protein HZ326_3205 [Fusarium oxysporum f. sp. albedinis]
MDDRCPGDSAHLSPFPPANYDIGHQLPLYQVPAPAQLLATWKSSQWKAVKARCQQQCVFRPFASVFGALWWGS